MMMILLFVDKNEDVENQDNIMCTNEVERYLKLWSGIGFCFHDRVRLLLDSGDRKL